MTSPIRRKRSLPALIVAALVSLPLLAAPAYAGPNGGNTIKFMAQQGAQYHANTRQEAQRRQAAEEEARRHRHARQHDQRQPHSHTSTAAAQNQE